MTKNCNYIYGFIKTTKRENIGSIGIEGAEVYTFPYGDISAVVSDSPPLHFNSYSKETLLRNLAIYQTVMEEVMKSYSIIPMKFGTMAESEEYLKKILEKGYERIKTGLEAIDNKIELNIVVTWSNFDTVLKEIGEVEEVRKYKEEALQTSSRHLHQARIEIGKMMKAVLDKEKEQYVSAITDILKEEAENHCLHATMDDSMILNAAFLIRKDKEDTFEAKVNQLNRKNKGRIHFRMIGPLPPYSFCTLQLKKMQFSEINEARKILSLSEEVSTFEINTAYKKMSKTYHPDKYPGDGEAQKRFEKISKAYNIVKEYCQDDTCFFREADIEEWISVSQLEQHGTPA
ncbi:MAG: GvpL/GvpF family gas vesicle protein [Thermodesulfobacteriota bacterium]|nr:GvpL/GvpF family gas vesicle protein [Thermodesulfobacteriota bacterium]